MSDHGAQPSYIVCEDWKSRRECLDIHESECICKGWKDEYIGASIYFCEFFFRLDSEKMNIAKFFLEGFEKWAISDDDLRSWSIE